MFCRGSDQGGGVGGINYAEYSDGSELNYKIYNLRGDVVLTLSEDNTIKSKDRYFAFGEHISRGGDIKTDMHRANTKVEDSGNLLNEGKRFRQLEYGIFLTPDPLEYVDGYNPYIYCGQNPWGKWDPLGLYITYGGTKEQNEKIESQLNEISKMSPKAAKIIAQLRNSDKEHRIDPIQYKKNKDNNKGENNDKKTLSEANSKANDTKNAGNGTGSGTVISYDPDNPYTYTSDRTTLEYSPLIILAHELSHSGDSDRGVRNTTMKDRLRDQPQNETNAIIVENEVAKALGKKLRTYHRFSREVRKLGRESKLHKGGSLSPKETLTDRDYNENYEKN